MSKEKFVYCRTSGVVYKIMRHSEKGPSKQKEKAYEMMGVLFANLQIAEVRVLVAGGRIMETKC